MIEYNHNLVEQADVYDLRARKLRAQWFRSFFKRNAR